MICQEFFHFLDFCGSDPHTTQVAIIGLGKRPSGLPLESIIANISGIAIPENCTKESHFLFANLCTLTNTGVTRAEWGERQQKEKGHSSSDLFSSSLGFVFFPVLATLLQVVESSHGNHLRIAELDLNLFAIQTNVTASPEAFVVPLSNF
jgi:hypothetical protein